MRFLAALVLCTPIAAQAMPAPRNCDGVRFDRPVKATAFLQLDDDAHRPTLDYARVTKDRCATASIAGVLAFTPTTDDIVAMDDGGRATFRERTVAYDRELTLRSRSDGSLERRYRVDGRPAEYDDAARRWLAAYLPALVQETRWNTSPRAVAVRPVGRIERADDWRPAPRDPLTLEDSLVDIQSSREKALTLRRHAQTSDRVTLAMVMRVARTIPNSTDKALLLESIAPRYLGASDSALAAAFFRTARTVPSSEELRDLLIAAVPFANGSDAVVHSIIDAARLVPSSGDRADVLASLVTSNAVKSESARENFVHATQELPGERDRRRVMLAASRH